MRIDEKIDGSLAVDFESNSRGDLYFFEVEQEEGVFLEYLVDFDYNPAYNRTAEISFEVSGEDLPQTNDKHGLISVGFRAATIVFHTVFMILIDFIERTEVEVLEFSARSDEKSRVKFYKTLAKELAVFRGYSPEDVEIGQAGKHTTYFVVPVAK